MMQAVFSTTSIVWFTVSPERDVPGTAVDPLPGALLLDVVASQPCHLEACSVHPLQDEGEGGV